MLLLQIVFKHPLGFEYIAAGFHLGSNYDTAITHLQLCSEEQHYYFVAIFLISLRADVLKSHMIMYD